MIDGLISWLLLIFHRSLLACYLIFKVYSDKRQPVKPACTILKKKPNHLLLKIESFQHDKFVECLETVKAHNIKYLTILSGECMVSVDLIEVELFKDHQAVGPKLEGAIKVNIITCDQKGYFSETLKSIYNADNDFRFNDSNLLSSMSPFPQVDLIISNEPRLSFEGCLPCQIGFAEMSHFPNNPLCAALIEDGLSGYSSAKQNFGK